MTIILIFAKKVGKISAKPPQSFPARLIRLLLDNSHPFNKTQILSLRYELLLLCIELWMRKSFKCCLDPCR